MLKAIYQFLLVVIVFAVIGGPAGYLAQSPQFAPALSMAEMPCDMAMPTADADHAAPMAPCKGLTPECIKQMGCVVDIALPTRLGCTDVAVAFSPVSYWSTRSDMTGVAREPEPLPPRTA